MSTQATTPLQSSFDDLPSLAYSSSPLGDSPRSVHNHSSRFYRLPISSLPKPESLPDALPSSPPGLEIYHENGNTLPALGPSAKLSENLPPLRDHKNGSSLRLSDILSTPTGPSVLGKRSSDEAGVAEEYSIMGSSFGFLVDTSGHVRISPLRAKCKKPMNLTREQILLQDSDSDNDEQSENLEFNAVGAFARVLTRSRIDSACPQTAPKTQELSFNRSFYDPIATSKSQGITLVAPSTPLSTGSFQTHIMTPPGSMFSFDHPMYSTGMTPYLPRS